MLIQYVIGPAGSGKTTLVKALVEYLQEYNQEITIVTINLDPGCRTLSYTPDIDIRDYVTVDAVMEKISLTEYARTHAELEEALKKWQK